MTLTVVYLLLPLVLTAFSTYAIDVCYFPNGDQDVNSWACNKTAYANGDGTACCSAGDTCMGNGVCYQGWTGVMYRQSCTDRTWDSPNCASVATTGIFNTSVGVWILQCDPNNKSWCAMGVAGSCCDNDTAGVQWDDWAPGYTIGLISNTDSDRGNNLVVSPGAEFATATTSSAKAVSATPTASQSTSATPTKATASQSTSATPTKATASATLTSSKSSDSLKVGVGVGVGVGVPLLLSTAALLFWLIKERRKRRVVEEQLTQMCATPKLNLMSDTRVQNPNSGPTQGRFHEASDDHQRNELWAGTAVSELQGDTNKHTVRMF